MQDVTSFFKKPKSAKIFWKNSIHGNQLISLDVNTKENFFLYFDANFIMSSSLCYNVWIMLEVAKLSVLENNVYIEPVSQLNRFYRRRLSISTDSKWSHIMVWRTLSYSCHVINTKIKQNFLIFRDFFKNNKIDRFFKSLNQDGNE